MITMFFDLALCSVMFMVVDRCKIDILHSHSIYCTGNHRDSKLARKNGADSTLAGWWFGTFVTFQYIGNNHPNSLIFFKGVETTNPFGMYDWFGGVVRAQDERLRFWINMTEVL